MSNKVISKLLIVGIILAFIVGMETIGLAAELDFKGEILMDPGAVQPYLPTRSMVKSPTNPYPSKILRDLADEWEAMHPDIKIEFPTVSKSSDRTWMVTQFTGDKAPDIIYQNMGTYRDQDWAKDWVIAMDPYLEKPNPYAEGNEKWLDLFYPVWMDAMRSSDGNVYWVAPDLVPIGIIYNKDIFAEVGVEVPDTFGQLIQICDKIQDAGYIAYSSILIEPTSWYAIPMECAMWADKIPEMDVIGRPNLVVNTEELVRGIKKGIFSAYDPRFSEHLRLNEKLTSYYPKGWAARVQDAPWRNFISGKSAMMEGVGIHIRRLIDDPEIKFELSVFAYPDLTKEDSEFGGTTMAGKGTAGYTATWQITNTAVDKGSVEACVDWLMYLTAPQNAERICGENGVTIPGVKGAKAPHVMQPFLFGVEKSKNALDWHALNSFHILDTQYQVECGRWREEYFLGTITLEETLDKADKSLNDSAERLINLNQWDTSKW